MLSPTHHHVLVDCCIWHVSLLFCYFCLFVMQSANSHFWLCFWDLLLYFSATFYLLCAFSCLSPSFNWLLCLTDELAFFFLFCLLYSLTVFQFLASFWGFLVNFMPFFYFLNVFSPAIYFKQTLLREKLVQMLRDRGKFSFITFRM